MTTVEITTSTDQGEGPIVTTPNYIDDVLNSIDSELTQLVAGDGALPIGTTLTVKVTA